MSRKEQTDNRFHDASDPRCADHAQAHKAGEPARRDRTCLKCLEDRGFAAPGVPLKKSKRVSA